VPKPRKADGAGGLGEGHRIVVRHGDVERRAQHVLRGRGPADGAVVAGAAIAGADDQRLAEAVAQGLQLVHGLGVDLDRAGAAAGDLGRGKAGPAPGGFRHVAEMGIGRGRHGGLQKCKTRLGGGWGTGSVVGGASVGAAALEGLEHHIPHGADVGFDALQPVGIGLAVIGALLVGSLALEVQFPVEALQHRLVGECLAGDGGGDGKAAADQRGDGGGQAVVAEGLADLLQDGGSFGHVDIPSIIGLDVEARAVVGDGGGCRAGVHVVARATGIGLAGRSVVISCSKTAPVTSFDHPHPDGLPFGGAAMNRVSTPPVAMETAPHVGQRRRAGAVIVTSCQLAWVPRWKPMPMQLITVASVSVVASAAVDP
jgi:hypothetical protein